MHIFGWPLDMGDETCDLPTLQDHFPKGDAPKEAHKTNQAPLTSMDISEGTPDGNIRVLHEIQRAPQATSTNMLKSSTMIWPLVSIS